MILTRNSPYPTLPIIKGEGRILTNQKEGKIMLALSRVLLIIAGILLFIEAIMLLAGISFPLFDWSMPCPVSLLLLGAGLFFFAVGSKKSFKKK
jgi:uncharacterized integral membrane protein